MSERVDPHEALLSAAQALNAGQVTEAEAICRRVIGGHPDSADAPALLGMIVAQRGDADGAIIHLRRACTLAPAVAGFHNNLALALARTGRIDNAIESFRTALELDPGAIFVLVNLGRHLRRVCRFAEAVECFRQALRRHPDSPELLCFLADTLAMGGKDEDAAPLYRQVIALRPDWAAAHYSLALVRKFRTEEDQDLLSLKRLAQSRELSDENRSYLSFALGKAYDDLGQYDLAFAYFADGNALRKADTAFNPANELAVIARVVEVFDAGLLRAKAGLGVRTQLPVFIIGMPRAGKTLLEQHLACYRGVYAGGESEYIHIPADNDSEAAAGWRFPDYAERLTQSHVQRSANAMLDQIRRVAPDATRFINTMPGNFLKVGLIRLMFPTAPIIHCTRDPLDTCLCCYFKVFRQGWDFTYDLELLGRYYAAYERVMGHWHTVLPHSVLQIRYEDLIANPEETAGTAAAYCGLSEADRIAPFPAIQRQGIEYRRKYASHLGPLVSALSDFLQSRSPPREDYSNSLPLTVCA